MPICIVGWRGAPSVCWHLQLPITAWQENTNTANSLPCTPTRRQLFIHKVQCDSRWQITCFPEQWKQCSKASSGALRVKDSSDDINYHFISSQLINVYCSLMCLYSFNVFRNPRFWGHWRKSWACFCVSSYWHIGRANGHLARRRLFIGISASLIQSRQPAWQGRASSVFTVH